MYTTLKVKVKDRWFTVEVDDLDSDPIHLLVEGEPVEVRVDHGEAVIKYDGDSRPKVDQQELGLDTKVFTAPMAGVVVSISVGVGDRVAVGDEVCVLEAMKMQQKLCADWAGVVSKIYVNPGQEVLDGDPILDL